MASPRSVWSGTISIGLLNVPVTIGKATSVEREKGLVTLCEDHHVPIDRRERCGAGDEGCSLSKVRGVQVGENGSYKVLSAEEFEQIEASTKRATLDCLDVQPIWDLPIWYGTGTYYLRPNDKVPGSEAAFALLVATLMESMQGIVTKWCKSARQELAVIHAQDNLLLLTTLPYASELREAGDKETKHQKISVDPAMVKMTKDLLASYNKGEFDHAAYEDEGLKLRTAAVEKILMGENMPAATQPVITTNPVPDLMQTLQASIEAAKS